MKAANRLRNENKKRHMHGDSVNCSTFITVWLTATDFNNRTNKLPTNMHSLYFACLEVPKGHDATSSCYSQRPCTYL